MSSGKQMSRETRNLKEVPEFAWKKSSAYHMLLENLLKSCKNILVAPFKKKKYPGAEMRLGRELQDEARFPPCLVLHRKE